MLWMQMAVARSTWRSTFSSLFAMPSRSSERVVDLFEWDEDRSGKIDKREFWHAVRALGFNDIPESACNAVFDSLDDDKSGQLEYKELNMMLRKDWCGCREAQPQARKIVRDDSRSAKMTLRNMNENFENARVAALPPMVKLDAKSECRTNQRDHG